METVDDFNLKRKDYKTKPLNKWCLRVSFCSEDGNRTRGLMVMEIELKIN